MKDVKRSLKMPDLTGLVKNISALVIAALSTFLLTWIFFKNVLFIPIALPMGVVIYKQLSDAEKKKQEQVRKRRCKDALLSMSAAISAGYSLEQSVGVSGRELGALWGQECDFLLIWRRMEREIMMNKPVEEAFKDFAKAVDIFEITELAQVLELAKRGGGQIGELFKTCATQLEEGLYVEAEIKTKLTQKRLEFLIMMIMPAFIMLYMQLSSPDICAVLYEALWGRAFMGVCLIVYEFCLFVGGAILKIEV